REHFSLKRLRRASPSRAASPFRPERKKTAAKSVNFLAFRFPAKGLSACYPNLADGQGCSSCCCNPARKAA
ncbi:hypothetical protein, partial [Bradyrhizobium brasilense]|uniref:hypothetical protein n=1 Tax=Bradyrhizobium brasilense TaxID=1419277 RepID=UPI001E5F63AB